MALTDEELKLQLNILTNRTDQNSDMVYKTNAILNKGLNPDHFSGQNTKIVNALNLLATNATQVDELSQSVARKVNEILLDTANDENLAIWNNVKNLMEEETIIEGLQAILEGKHANKLLGLNLADKGKVLSVDQDANGNPILKAIDMIAQGPTNVSAETLAYTNSEAPNVTNVKDALDYLITSVKDGSFEGGLGGGTIIGEITWDMIDDRPEFIADGLELTNDQLQLKDGDSILAFVPLAGNEDINDIIDDLI